MKTYLECIPCFMNQALRAMEQYSLDENTQERILKGLMAKLSLIDLKKSPPQFALYIYEQLEKMTGISDPYKEIKKRDNEHALNLLPEVTAIIDRSDDKLLIATKIAIAGNIMDFASGTDYDIKKHIFEIIDDNFEINHYDNFKQDIEKAHSIAYIADNSGEIVFDKLLLKEIMKINDSKIDFYVRSKPIVDDATIEDAEHVGIADLGNIDIKTFDTVFPMQEINSDIVISKGQANYECLSGFNSNIYFLLMTKCSIIARDLNTKKQKLILKKNNNTR